MEQVRSSSSLTCGSVAQVRPSRRVFLRRIVTLVLFVLPWGYVGVIAGVAVHEVVGHGLTALAVGGRFEGFELEWYGMGWASAYPAPGAPTWHESVVLLGGVAATVALGGLLLGLAALLPGLWLRTAGVILGTCIVLDSAAYTFWSALHPGTQGDAARVVLLWDSSAVQWVLVVGGAVLTIGTTWISTSLLFRCVASYLVPGQDEVRAGRGELSGLQRATIVVLFFVVPSVGAHYAFDWNQLISGIGNLPAHANMGLVAILSPLLFFSIRPWPNVEPRAPLIPVVLGWILAVAIGGMVEAWLSQGVSWS